MNSLPNNVDQTYWTGPIEDSKRYRIEGVKGALLEYARGGEGVVFRAMRSGPSDGVSKNSFVALKLLANVVVDDYQRIHDRCLALSGVVHTNIMRQGETFIGASFWTDSMPHKDDFDVIFCVAEWIDGGSLQDAMENANLVQKLTWVCEIARAVQFLHDFRSPLAPNGIIHRDIKPSNVRIRGDGQAVLIDFGMSRPNHGNDLTRGAGTFLWMAPEAIGESPNTGPYSDVWGVGALAHWVIAGIPPRLDDTTTIRRERIRSKCSELGTRKSRAISKLISSLLESNPQQRPGELSTWAKSAEKIFIEQSRCKRVPDSLRKLTSKFYRLPIAILSMIAIGSGVWAVSVEYSHHNSSNLKPKTLAPPDMYKYRITIPGSASGDVSEYSGPSTRDQVTGKLVDGSSIYIECQESGSEVGYPEYTVVWDLLKSGSYVSDFFTTTPTPYNFSPNIPRCQR